MEPLNLATGAHVSPVDPRDWTLASVGAPTTYSPSCFIDHVDIMRVSMQGQIGCCVGCTGEEMVRKIILAMTGVDEDLSFRFVYAVAKCLDGIQDQGTYPSLVANIIRTYGVPLAKYCPNDVTLDHETFVYNRKMTNIPPEAFADAKTRRSGADMTEPVTLDGIKKAINYAQANNGGVMILREVGNTYWTGKDGISTWDKAKLLPIAVPAQITSGHEEFLYGYDEELGTGRTRIYWLNHWSDSWASTGGNSHDGGRGWEYADVWLPLVKELRVVVASIPVNPSFKYTFTKQLNYGMKGPDVVALQHVLKNEGLFPESQSFTGFFGNLTMAGVVAFQDKYASEILTPAGLTQGTGIVGPYTLKKLNALYGI